MVPAYTKTNIYSVLGINERHDQFMVWQAGVLFAIAKRSEHVNRYRCNSHDNGLEVYDPDKLTSEEMVDIVNDLLEQLTNLWTETFLIEEIHSISAIDKRVIKLIIDSPDDSSYEELDLLIRHYKEHPTAGVVPNNIYQILTTQELDEAIKKARLSVNINISDFNDLYREISHILQSKILQSKQALELIDAAFIGSGITGEENITEKEIGKTV